MLFSSLKKISFLSFIFLPFVMISQTTEIQYLETRNIESQLEQIDNPVIKEMIIKKIGQPVLFQLVYSNGVSSYSQHTETSNNDDENVTVVSGNSKTNKVYKKLDTKDFVKTTNLFGKNVIISDTLVDFKWSIKDEIVTIDQYSCKVAEGVHNDKKIIAYFTEQILINDGPEIYQGLPGLIIKLETPDKTYMATNITIKKEGTEITIPSSKESISSLEYEKLKAEQVKNLKRSYGDNVKVIKS